MHNNESLAQTHTLAALKQLLSLKVESEEISGGNRFEPKFEHGMLHECHTSGYGTRIVKADAG